MKWPIFVRIVATGRIHEPPVEGDDWNEVLKLTKAPAHVPIAQNELK
jgi:hypothetical protein